jgi:hypothetical protein
MGTLVGAYATSHTAMIIRKFRPGDDVHAAVHEAFAQVRAEVARLAPDLLVVIGSEHLNSFSYDCFPPNSRWPAPSRPSSSPTEWLPASTSPSPPTPGSTMPSWRP